jgi:hypothetical protein
MAKFMVKPGGVPPGTYRARFTGAENSDHPDFGPGVRFGFEVLAGPHRGEKVSRITACNPTPRNSAGRILAGLAGRTLTADELIDSDDFVGRQYDVEVEAADNGATRVASVAPAPDLT